ncbi:unnamed protein product [Acanthosepion pharaonis]|uniref:Uncharacterized protein n=1 Tax=Acanthosepion pharaonis TaxID=158019 RepID=A0A812E8K6_ACAPH|nr:unnamed protein product [Sepia pharaonis]
MQENKSPTFSRFSALSPSHPLPLFSADTCPSPTPSQSHPCHFIINPIPIPATFKSFIALSLLLYTHKKDATNRMIETEDYFLLLSLSISLFCLLTLFFILSYFHFYFPLLSLVIPDLRSYFHSSFIPPPSFLYSFFFSFFLSFYFHLFHLLFSYHFLFIYLLFCFSPPFTSVTSLSAVSDNVLIVATRLVFFLSLKNPVILNSFFLSCFLSFFDASKSLLTTID